MNLKLISDAVQLEDEANYFARRAKEHVKPEMAYERAMCDDLAYVYRKQALVALQAAFKRRPKCS